MSARRFASATAIFALLVVSCGNRDGGSTESLASALGLSDTDVDVSTALVRVSIDRTEEATRACMKRDGFEYQPPILGTENPGFPGDEEGLLSDDDYAATYGFGLVEMVWPSQAATPRRAQPSSDPNASTLGEMSNSEAEQWISSLAMCQQAGEEKGFEVYEQLSELTEFMASVPARVSADERVRRAQRDWTECMALEGFAYEDDEAMMVDLEEAAFALLAEPSADFEPLREKELRVAIAFQSCRGPLEQARQTVRLELESQALEDPRIRNAVESFSDSN